MPRFLTGASGPHRDRLAHAQTRDLTTSGVLLDRVAAVVNDGVVLTSELDEADGLHHRTAAGAEGRAAS